MDKKTALEYIIGQGKRVTAKQVSIDLDAPISTTTELLERMSAQALLERDRDQRPREYTITEEGKNRLNFFLNRDPQPSPISPSARASQAPTPPVAGNPSERGADLHGEFDKFREEIFPKLDALREDFRDLLDGLAAKPSSVVPAPTETIPSRADRILARLQKPAEEREDSDQQGRIQKLLDAHIATERAGLFSRGRLRGEAEALEGGLPPGIVKDVKALAELEAFTLFVSDAKRAEIVRLRERLGLSAESAKAEGTESARVET